MSELFGKPVIYYDEDKDHGNWFCEPLPRAREPVITYTTIGDPRTHWLCDQVDNRRINAVGLSVHRELGQQIRDRFDFPYAANTTLTVEVLVRDTSDNRKRIKRHREHLFCVRCRYEQGQLYAAVRGPVGGIAEVTMQRRWRYPWEQILPPGTYLTERLLEVTVYPARAQIGLTP